MNVSESFSASYIGTMTTVFTATKTANLGRPKYKCLDEKLVNLNKNISSFSEPSTNASWNDMLGWTASYDVTNQTLVTTLGAPVTREDRSATNALYISLYAIVLLLAVVGNSLVIMTIASNKRMRNLTNIFLLSMAVSDLLIALVCMPINLTGRILTRFVFGSFMCKLSPYVIGVSVMVSTYTMLVISIERYFAICCPFGALTRQTKAHAYRMTVGIWVASLLVMLPYAIASNLKYLPIPKLGACVQACRLVIENETLSKSWYTFLLVGMFCLPGIIMAIAYFRVCVTLRKGFQFQGKQDPREANGNGSAQRHEDQSSSLLANKQQFASSSLMPPEKASSPKRKLETKTSHNNNPNTNTRTVVMLIMIVVLYFCFWTPLYIANMWKAFDFNGAMRNLEGSIEIIKLMSYISTCINPVIYCFMNKKFREGFIKAFLCCLPARCAQKVKRRPFNSQAVSETQQMTIVTSSARLPRRSTSPV